MSQRPGVVSLHLAVDMNDDHTMTMLYKINQGVVKEEHYGLALARVVDLPPGVLEVAEKVSNALTAQVEAKQKSSKAFALAKRRKLVLSLREALKQAESSPMQGDVLLSWLRKLQEEFTLRKLSLTRGMVDPFHRLISRFYRHGED
jgi:DNA mismatch repair protein MSH4